MTVATSRPTQHDPRIAEIVADKLTPRLVAHLDENRPDEVRRDILAVLQDEFEWDGYKLARSLERDHYWDCDSGIVEILDRAGFERHNAHDALIAEWVKANGVKCRFKGGDTVKVKYKEEAVSGEIVRFYADHARYIVCVESLGHVRSDGRTEGTLGLIVNDEDVLE